MLSVLQERREKGHAERLAPLVQEVLAQAGKKISDLDRIAVTVGPGSFTGVRVGLAFARGLAIGQPLKVAGVTTLEAIAAGVVSHADTVRVVLIDARRGQVYGQIFPANGLHPLIEPFVLNPEQAKKLLDDATEEKQAVFAGSGVPLVYPEKKHDFAWADQQPDAVTIARIGLEKPAAKTLPSAFYLRAADAKPAKPSLLRHE